MSCGTFPTAIWGHIVELVCTDCVNGFSLQLNGRIKLLEGDLESAEDRNDEQSRSV